ncbi:MAG: hypothetical protein RIB71_18275 [Imperialibacter sp.]|uniref:hypothetical protein n=1 Tax=Imperialibacter sp. TaxID=2038411 RepID=UPI0032EBCCD1
MREKVVQRTAGGVSGDGASVRRVAALRRDIPLRTDPFRGARLRVSPSRAPGLGVPGSGLDFGAKGCHPSHGYLTLSGLDSSQPLRHYQSR